MKKSLPLAMPGATALCALIVVAAVVGLAGCTDKHVTEVKALPFSYPSENVQDPNMTVDQALDYRKICDSVKWKVDQTEQHRTFVQYTCTYKGVDDSQFVKRDHLRAPKRPYLTKGGEVYQWIYGPSGQPTLSYVTQRMELSDGTVNELTNSSSYPNQTAWTTALMQLAVSNAVANFDQLWSQVTGAATPDAATLPTKPIPVTAYANDLGAYFPDKSPLQAASLAFQWYGLSWVITGMDELNYPIVKIACWLPNNTEWSCHYPMVSGAEVARDEKGVASALFPVDPKDVQIALVVDKAFVQETVNNWDNGVDLTKLKSFVKLSPMKLLCAGLLCFDHDGHVVGRAPDSVVAREVSVTTLSSTPVDSVAAAMASTATPPPAPAPTVTLAVAAPMAAATEVSKSGDVGPDGWPKMTPCIEKLQEKFTIDQQKQNADTSTSLEQMQEWADVCKSLGK